MKMPHTLTKIGIVFAGLSCAFAAQPADGHTDFPDLKVTEPPRPPDDPADPKPNVTIKIGQIVVPNNNGTFRLPFDEDQGMAGASYAPPFPPVPVLEQPTFGGIIPTYDSFVPSPSGAVPTPGATLLLGIGASLGLIRRRR